MSQPLADPRSPIGLVLGSHMSPRDIIPLARLAEDLGFGELWFSEDCWFSGGMAGAAAALGATTTLPLGLGIVAASTRHPSLTAMEIATLDGMFPGRVYGGIGHGVPHWLDQMGLRPDKPMTALRQALDTVRRLLDGGTVSEDGHFHFDEITLTHPAPTRVPLYTGVVGERGLRMSGEVADGTVLSTLSSPAYVRWARDHITAGAEAAGRTEPHRLVTYALYSVASDSKVAKQALREAIAPHIAAIPDSALGQVFGIQDELTAMLKAGGPEAVARDMPDEWLDGLAVSGDPEECAELLRQRLDAGSDSVGLWLFPADRADEVARLTAKEVLPRL
jgi:alkanesulfonate monooxygenase SsuD/methylene tetrahydromethanopterin reductase-like flavin-dependent oxidoreductase (luciferase family)